MEVHYIYNECIDIFSADGWCTVVTTKIYARYQGGKGDKCSILAGIHLVDLGLVPGNHIMKG